MLNTDTCVPVWNWGNTMLSMTCQVTSNIWSNKTAKKQCQSATVRDEHRQVEKGRNSQKMSEW